MKRVSLLLILGLFVSSTATLLLSQTSSALYVKGWQAGDIMSDAVMANSSTMTASQIQTFLNNHVNPCQTNGVQPYPAWVTTASPFICLRNYSESTSSTYTVKYSYKDTGGTTRNQNITYTANNYYKITGFTVTYKNGDYKQGIASVKPKFQNVNGATPSGAKSAATLIYNAAQDYHINPQVLLVTLAKEQNLIDDNWPTPLQYYSATGYNCTDSAPCDPGYANFNAQVRAAAKHFRAFLNGPGNYHSSFILGNNTIAYSPNCSTGSTVNIKNLATLALYTYTPYQPNAYALNGGSNSGPPDCGAFGNRNFYSYFNEWFGSTHYTVKGSIATYYNSGNNAAILGEPTENEQSTANGGWKQCFNGGCIVGSAKVGYWTLQGSIATKYWGDGGPNEYMGLPIGEVTTINGGGYYQAFQGGYIVGQYSSGYWDIKGSIGKKINVSDFQTIGLPLAQDSPISGGWEQRFSKGYMVGAYNTGYWPIYGNAYDSWVAAGRENGSLGLPSGAKTTATGITYQKFTSGYIAGVNDSSYYSVGGSIGKFYSSGSNFSILGAPLGALTSPASGAWEQKFVNGYVIGTYSTGYWISNGEIRDTWVSAGREASSLGMPISEEVSIPGGAGTYQRYEHGVIAGSGTDYHSVSGSIGKLYGLDNNIEAMGSPLTDMTSSGNSTWQQKFQNGYIIGSYSTGYWIIRRSIYQYWASNPAEKDRLALPLGTIMSLSSGWIQHFQNGSIAGSTKIGYRTVVGSISKVYSSGNNESILGLPEEAEYKDAGGIWHQKFEHGEISGVNGRYTVSKK